MIIQASDILRISNIYIYDAFKTFNSVFADEGKAVDMFLAAHGLTRPVTLGQIQGLTSRQRAAFKKAMLPMIVQTVALNDFEGELLELGYASIQTCIDDLPNMFSGNLLNNLTTNFTEAKQARVKLVALINDDLILSQITVLVDVADDIKARHIEVHGV